MALGRLWHPEHFTCVQCKEPLGTRNFFERDTLPYCERDYHLMFSPQCASCGGPVLDVSRHLRTYHVFSVLTAAFQLDDFMMLSVMCKELSHIITLFNRS